MRIFLSYASPDRAQAARLNTALLAEGHDVFYDRDDLPAGEEFHQRIRRAIERSHLLVFLISEAALDPGSYTISELEIAQKAVLRPNGGVLPVLLEPIPFARLPEFLKSVTVLETQGDLVATLTGAVDRINRSRRQRTLHRAAVGLGLALLAVAGLWLAAAPGNMPSERAGNDGGTSLLVTAGPFVMGDDENEPRREVFMSAFYIDRHEVTTGRYAKFLAATGSVRPPENWNSIELPRSEVLPVTGVDWEDASAYCRWAGRRLPTEAEWEKAARGTDERRYPWGNEAPTYERANFENTAPQAYEGGLRKAGAHTSGRSPYGAEDMAGNVNEWVADWYSESFPAGAARDPKGPANGSARVIRGGDRFDTAERITVTRRYHAAPETRSEGIGFRCAMDAS
jgi:formylglycine-generating enzyme required for sulfatase activity